MATAHLHERMKHIMSLSSQRRFLSHRFVVSAAVITITAFTIAAGAARAQKAVPKGEYPYKLRFDIKADAGGHAFMIAPTITDSTGRIVSGNARIKSLPGEDATLKTSTGDDEITVTFNVKADGSGSAVLHVTRHGEVLEDLVNTFSPQAKEYTGDPISIDLKDAEIHDVLSTFSKVTGVKIVADADVTGLVTVHFTDVPWDKAFEIILTQNNLRWEMSGDTIHVFK